MSSSHEKNWLQKVAAAAPDTPQPKTKMKSGSKKMFSTAPETRPIMAYWALPCSRSWLFITRQDIMMGVAASI